MLALGTPSTAASVAEKYGLLAVHLALLIEGFVEAQITHANVRFRIPMEYVIMRLRVVTYWFQAFSRSALVLFMSLQICTMCYKSKG